MQPVKEILFEGRVDLCPNIKEEYIIVIHIYIYYIYIYVCVYLGKVSIPNILTTNKKPYI